MSSDWQQIQDEYNNAAHLIALRTMDLCHGDKKLRKYVLADLKRRSKEYADLRKEFQSRLYKRLEEHRKARGEK